MKISTVENTVFLMQAITRTALFVILLFSPIVSNAEPEVEVMHWWNRGGDLRAMQVIRDEFEHRGGIWFDVAGDDSIDVLNTAVSRMIKGYAPTLVQWNSAWEVTEIRNLGLLNTLNMETSNYLHNAFIDNVLDMIMVNGEIVAIPVNVHSENWLWYKPDNLPDNGPRVMADWKAFLEFAESLAETGKIALAVGDTPRQQRALFNNVLLGVAGQDLFQRIYYDLDVGALSTKGFSQALATYAKLREYSHSFGEGRWDQQLAAVAANKAFTVNMGDWAKGEFRNLGLKLGRDYDCAPAPGTGDHIVLVIDAFVLGQVSEKNEKQGQQLFMDVVTNPVVSETFNYLKGSLSPLREIDTEGLDKCSQVAHTILKTRGKAIKPHASIGDRGFLADIDHLISELWTGCMVSTEWTTDFSTLLKREKMKRISKSNFSQHVVE